MKKRSQVSQGVSAERAQEIDDLFSVGPNAPVVVDIESDAGDTTVSGALPPPVPIFDTASGGGRPDLPPMPDLHEGFQEIVRDLFQEGLDVVGEYRAIKDSLTIKDALTPGNVQAAANRAEEMADRAFRLYMVAVSEHAAYQREIEVIVAALRDGATAQLEREKAEKTRTKQITDGDVQSTISQLYPDEWDEVQRRKIYAKGMLDYIGNLSDLAKRRCFTVSKMQKD